MKPFFLTQACDFHECYQTSYMQGDKPNDLIHTVSHWQSKYVPVELVYCSTTTTWHGTGHLLAYKTINTKKKGYYYPTSLISDEMIFLEGGG